MSIWASLVYVLCLVTCVLCATLLVRSYFKTRTKLLLWCAACFVLLTVNNCLVVMDVLLLPGVDLTILRNIFGLAAVATLLYGFVWEID